MQTRASRVNDVLTTEEVNEIADAPPGVTKEAVRAVAERSEDVTNSGPVSQPQSNDAAQEEKQGYATVQQDGKVEFEEVGSHRQSQ